MKKILIALIILWFAFAWRKYRQSKKIVQEIWTWTNQSWSLLPFYIETMDLYWSWWSETFLTKNGKIQGKSEITVTSLVAGRVSTISKKIGDEVDPNTLIVAIEDSNGQISFGLEKAKVALDTAQNNYVQQEENLKKQLDDARIAYERSQLQKDTTVKDIQKQLQKSQYDLANTDATIPNSTTNIQLEKLRKDLEKAEFDYQSKLTADQQSQNNFLLTATNIHNDSILLLRDIFDASDSILGISSKYQFSNDAWESNLWALDSQTFSRASNAAVKVQGILDQLKAKSASFTIDTLSSDLSLYKDATEQVYVLVTSMKDMFSKTVPGNNLSETQLNTRRSQYDWYQSKAQGSIASITSQINAIASFLSSYKQSQESIAKSIESLKSQIALTEKQLDDAQFNTKLGTERTEIAAESSTQQAELWLQSAKNTVDYLSSTRDITLESIQNQLRASEVSYNEIANNADKFNSKSPVKGVIADVFVDPGQDINPWTPLYKVVSDQQEIEITVTTEELEIVELDTQVKVKWDIWEVSGRVVSRSAVADKNWNFKIIIALDSDTLKVGTFADVMISTSKSGIGIPVNAVRIVDNGVGEIFLRNGSSIEKKTIELGQLLGTQIEVKSSLPSRSQLVLTNMERYDPKVHEIELKR